MSLPTWEIVIICIIVITITFGTIYAFIRCWKSIKATCIEPVTKRSQSPQARATPRSSARSGNDVPEVYGVPYRPPDVTPSQLDPTKLNSLVMESKSDLHPYYLEKKEDLGNPIGDIENKYQDHKVTWRPDDILVESEFVPSTSIPAIYIHRDNISDSSSLSKGSNGASSKPKKVVRINYDKGTDGAPEITSFTTEEDTSYESRNSSSEEPRNINSSGPVSDTGEEQKDADVQVDRISVEIGNPQHDTTDSSSRENWVEFDDTVSDVVNM